MWNVIIKRLGVHVHVHVGYLISCFKTSLSADGKHRKKTSNGKQSVVIRVTLFYLGQGTAMVLLHVTVLQIVCSIHQLYSYLKLKCMNNSKKMKIEKRECTLTRYSECSFNQTEGIYYISIYVIILYNLSSYLSRKSRGRENNTQCLPWNKYQVSPLRKSKDFSFQRYEKDNMSIRCGKL